MKAPTIFIAGSLVLAVAIPASASERSFHWRLGGGTFASAGRGAPWGLGAQLDLLPGGAMDRYGAFLSARTARLDFDRTDLVVGGLFEAGSTRPHLTLLFSGGIGISAEDLPIVSAGIHWTFGVWNLTSLTLDTQVRVLVDGAETRPTLSIGLSFDLGS